MKNTEVVIVEMAEKGRHKRYAFPIMTEDGTLMTHRLRRLMMGKCGSRRSDGNEVEQHFVGMVWKPPYTVLQTLLDERSDLQEELLIREGHNELTDVPLPEVPSKRIPNDEMTCLVSYELKLRKALKADISKYDREHSRQEKS